MNSPMMANATTPEGASVVNNTSVISPSAVSIPETMPAYWKNLG